MINYKGGLYAPLNGMDFEQHYLEKGFRFHHFGTLKLGMFLTLAWSRYFVYKNFFFRFKIAKVQRLTQLRSFN